MEVAQQIWSQLDNLYAKDPKAYGQFLQKLKQDAIEGTEAAKAQLPQGVFTLQCSGTIVNGSPQHYINVCQSEKLKARVEDKITVVVSKQRRGKNADGTIYHVYDAVVHKMIIAEARSDSLFANGLQDLVIDCIEEAFSIRIDRKNIRKLQSYKAPYGWDENGRPIDGDGATEDSGRIPSHTIPEPVDLSKMTTSSLLTRMHADSELSSAAEASSPSDTLPALNLPDGNGTAGKRGTIQELDAVGTTPLGRGKGAEDGRHSTRMGIGSDKAPMYTTTTGNGNWMVEIVLPAIESASDVAVYATDISIDMETEGTNVSIPLPKGVDVDTAKCKFYKASRILQITCSCSTLA
ncbi:uncharacterized protein SPPG_08175 [Spizellomyces punctatus DAOM BR117]|uniref:PIH1 N-terminal domain-containing protein n=1 Tax=Spizellomyces punctatus (strain DAOM BR117) TaxID=645134 RepID=A0A0L0H6U7_SPIPD|nr:uncharacterized protein SPPG_08175 [Spizellomyces punctatus DAOM BR117]KNC96591.1 hypothetical protein SPPG_08175 [Spizellomyces punctatus DAOM BR117]|eukprot:XP_016604631.1 hypothetical protein SPPG_08175 [Spizellomyces punctatus DAOM BR117]